MTYIFIDTPPIAMVADALILAPYIDLCLIVVRQRYTSKNTLSIINNSIKTKLSKILEL